MKIDLSWESNKKSLAGFLVFIGIITIAYLLGISGLLTFVLAILGWYITYRKLKKPNDSK